jgi:ribosomal protein S18 acetylase RimI-like enzyme
MSIEVRRATIADLDTVIELRLALLREYGDHPIYGRLHPEAEIRARPVFAQQLQSPDQALFLAAHDGRIAGVARCVDSKGSPLLMPDRYCYVTSVYVRPEHRRLGVLAALMAHVEEWSRMRGLLEMRLHNSTLNAATRAAWDRLGFEINEEVRHKFLSGADPSSRSG